jgi:hypothetical protein
VGKRRKRKEINDGEIMITFKTIESSTLDSASKKMSDWHGTSKKYGDPM